MLLSMHVHVTHKHTLTQLCIWLSILTCLRWNSCLFTPHPISTLYQNYWTSPPFQVSIVLAKMGWLSYSHQQPHVSFRALQRMLMRKKVVLIMAMVILLASAWPETRCYKLAINVFAAVCWERFVTRVTTHLWVDFVDARMMTNWVALPTPYSRAPQCWG